MKRVLILLAVILPACLSLRAQISYGGKPLPEVFLRSSAPTLAFEEMPPFDLAEELRIDSLEKDGLRGGYRFAYKFMTAFSPDNSGVSTLLPDGTKVWRLGIRSAGAFSLGVLFTEYELPQGAKLFLYNKDRTHILGAFDHRNNSQFRILPVSPVDGEDLIIEYQEPAGVPFAGKLTVGEVNHSYRDFRIEPGGDNQWMSCIPAFICDRQGLASEQTGRSVVLLIINGTTSCTGVMVNNTAADGRPFVLTASHCLNNNFLITSFGKVDTVAGTIVTYFNYDSPLCNPVERGTEEMSMASSHCIALNTAYDMALLELPEIPPVHYRPYYAGWNVSFSPSSPFFSIHHPSRSVKRINWTDRPLSLDSFPTDGLPDFISFKDTHWFVDQWLQGSTQAGSSGAPLFNVQEQVIGLLTGGYSQCHSPERDYFYALAAAWMAEGSPELRLAHWLDPLNTSASDCPGLDPYEGANAVRMSNFRNLVPFPQYDTDIDPDYDFGNREQNMTQFAEAYHTPSPLTVFGAYLVTPPIRTRNNDIDVDVCLFTGLDYPEQLLHAEPFRPTYTSVNTGRDNLFYQTSKSLLRFQESFIRFETPVRVPPGNFYVGYRIHSPSQETYFAVCNLAAGRTSSNTAWFFDGLAWKEATAYPVHPGHTSLYIDPVVRYASFSSTPPLPLEPLAPQLFVDNDRQTIHILLPPPHTSARLTVVSSGGFIVSEHHITASPMSLPLNLPHGLYFLRLWDGKDLYTWKVLR
jgi:hypothetical protein